MSGKRYSTKTVRNIAARNGSAPSVIVRIVTVRPMPCRTKRFIPIGGWMRPTSRENHQHDPEPKRIEAEPLHRREDHWERQHQHRDGIEERAQHHIDEDDRPEDQPSADPRVVGRRHDFLRYLEVI